MYKEIQVWSDANLSQMMQIHILQMQHHLICVECVSESTVKSLPRVCCERLPCFHSKGTIKEKNKEATIKKFLGSHCWTRSKSSTCRPTPFSTHAEDSDSRFSHFACGSASLPFLCGSRSQWQTGEWTTPPASLGTPWRLWLGLFVFR